jgi:hypothetical protein
MKLKLAGLAMAALFLMACGREATESDGNGPGNADGFGGREDPPTAPAAQGSESRPAAETAQSEPPSGSQ